MALSAADERQEYEFRGELRKHGLYPQARLRTRAALRRRHGKHHASMIKEKSE
jgi:hypothetical protein